MHSISLVSIGGLCFNSRFKEIVPKRMRWIDFENFVKVFVFKRTFLIRSNKLFYIITAT